MNSPEPFRQRALRFLDRQFPGQQHETALEQLPGDASTRRYFRYRLADSLILAVYEKPFNEKDFSYHQMHQLYLEIALPIPRTLAMDGKLGVVLQEDLGDEMLQTKLAAGDPDEARRWLLRAIDYLITLQEHGSSLLDPDSEASRLTLDREKLLWELRFFNRHYLDDHRQIDLANPQALEEEMERLAGELDSLPRVLCHRDYQVRNLMVRNEELYITDFQDTRWGPYCYDLVSLLKDSIDLDDSSVDTCKKYYLERAGLMSSDLRFERHFHLMAVQRLLKALGTYGNQIKNLGKDTYLEYVRGSLKRALLSLEAVGEFPYIQSIVEFDLERGDHG